MKENDIISKRFITVEQMIKKLQGLDPSGKMPVVVRGHFGEAHPVSLYGFGVANTYTTENGGWRGDEKINFKALEISPIDIGEEPD